MRKYWKYTEEDLRKAVKKSISFRETLLHLGMSQSGGGNYGTLKRRVEEINIDTSHFLGRRNPKGLKNLHHEKFPLESVLVVDSTYQRSNLKRRLIGEGILKNKCSECGRGDVWQGKKLVMVLDHINGVNNDNRLENLRMLCPNCNSQTETFCGRNKKHEKRVCLECKGEVSRYSKSGLCRKCSNTKTWEKRKNMMR